MNNFHAIAQNAVGRNHIRSRSTRMRVDDRNLVNVDVGIRAWRAFAAVVLLRIARVFGTVRDVNQASRFAQADESLCQLGILSLDRPAEVSDELALVPALVVDRNRNLNCGTRNRIRNGRGSAGQVVHDKLPLPGEVAGRKRHLGIDRLRVSHQRGHRLAVPDEVDLNRRIVVVRVDIFLDAFGSRNVRVGIHDLKHRHARNGVVGHDVEPQAVGIRPQPEVANLPGPAVLVILLAVRELVETPVVAQSRVALNEIPHGFHVRHQFQHRLRVLDDRAAFSPRPYLRVNPALQMPSMELAGRQRVLARRGRRQGQLRHRRIPSRRHRHQGIAPRHPTELRNAKRLCPEPIRSRQSC